MALATKGDKIFVMTLGFFWVGEVAEINEESMLLKDASWVAATGLLSEFLATGTSRNCETEYAGEVRIPLNVLKKGDPVIQAILPWPHALFPRTRLPQNQ